jgi:hypothetical protein
MQYDEVMRDKQLNIRLTSEEVEHLQGLAKKYDTNTAGVIRRLLARAEEQLHVERRWSFIKDEAIEMARTAQIPGLKVWFNDHWHVIYLDDGVDAVTVVQGDGVWFELAQWPGSKLGTGNYGGMDHRKRLPESCVHRYTHNDPPAFETPKKK